MAGGGRTEGPVAPVGQHGMDAGQGGQRLVEQRATRLDVVGPGRVDPRRHRQAHDLHEDGALGAADAPAGATGLVVRGPVAAALHGLGVDDDHRGARRASVLQAHERR